jgi:acyl-CoA synthetase (AMP-forming)/AMP-acid ligase II
VHIVNTVSATAIVAAADHSTPVLQALPQLPSVRLAIGTGVDHKMPLDIASVISDDESEPPVEVDPESLLAIQFTSGTTGAPKGCMIKHRSKLLARMSELTIVDYSEEDRAIVFMPVAAGFGSDMLHTHVLRGMTTVLMPRFEAGEMLRLIEAERITVVYAIESVFDRLLAHENLDKIDWSRVRYFYCSSATRDLEPGVARLKQLKTFHAKIWSGFACAEAGGWSTYLSPEDIEGAWAGKSAERLRSVGREYLLANVDCVDDQGRPVPQGEIGEIVLSAPWTLAGYWGLPEKTAEVLRNGRYYTGDLARKDADGYVYLEGRAKDMIKSGGVSVYPAEIEMVLRGHPKVKEVAVVGVQDAQWGEKVVACVIPRAPAEEAELIEYCKRELAGFKCPKAVVFVSDFPRDAAGKILKRELRSQLTAAHASA